MGNIEPAWLRYHGEKVNRSRQFEPRALECVGDDVHYVVVGYDDGMAVYDRSGKRQFSFQFPERITSDAMRALAIAITRNCDGLYNPGGDERGVLV